MSMTNTTEEELFHSVFNACAKAWILNLRAHFMKPYILVKAEAVSHVKGLYDQRQGLADLSGEVHEVVIMNVGIEATGDFFMLDTHFTFGTGVQGRKTHIELKYTDVLAVKNDYSSETVLVQWGYALRDDTFLLRRLTAGTGIIPDPIDNQAEKSAAPKKPNHLSVVK